MKIAHITSFYRPRDTDAQRRMALARLTWGQVYNDYSDRIFSASHSIEEARRTSRVLGDDRKLPFIKDLVAFGFELTKPARADAVLLTNSDSCLMPSMIPFVFEALQSFGCYYSLRYDHHRITAPLTEEQARKAPIFPGADLFSFTREWWQKYEIDYPDMLLGAEAWDGVLKEMMKLAGFIEGPPIVYHERHAAYWVQHMLTSRSQVHNRTLAAQWIRKHGVADFLCKPPPGLADLSVFSATHVTGANRNIDSLPQPQGNVRPTHRPQDQNISELRHAASVLALRGQLDQAIKVLEHAIRLSPMDASLHKELGDVLDRAARSVQAITSYRHALRLRSDFHEVWPHLAIALLRTGDNNGALAACQKAIDANPKHSAAYNVLGTVLTDCGQHAESLAAYRRAIHLNPESAEAHANYGIALLRSGDFLSGWTEHEWRLKRGAARSLRFGSRWDASNPSGKTLLLHGEGGLGDVIHFSRYVPLVHERGARVIVECQPKLIPLISTVQGIWKLIAPGDQPPPHDAHCSLVSLPALLDTTLETIPAKTPYLHADPETVERWRPVVQQVEGFRIGVCWFGDSQSRHLLDRSFDPKHLLPLAEIPQVKLISIQHAQSVPPDSPIVNLPGLEPEPLPLSDVAAVMQHLDLVISCDTAIAHLAGALGRPVWVALKSNACWRWMLGREDSPWYPPMRLFRQEKKGDWPAVFIRMAETLRQQLQNTRDSSPIFAPTAPGELLDRLCILQIKSQRLSDPLKIKAVRVELEALSQVRQKSIPLNDELTRLADELRTVNESLWQVEDDIRAADALGDFGPRYVELSRRVYRTNDRRAELKRRINTLLGSAIRDEKQYHAYIP